MVCVSLHIFALVMLRVRRTPNPDRTSWYRDDAQGVARGPPSGDLPALIG